jgi:hypothetical protein
MKYSQRDFSIRTGYYGDCAYISRQFRSKDYNVQLISNGSITLNYNGMMFRYEIRDIIKAGVKRKKDIFHQFGTYRENAIFLNKDSVLFKKIFKHMEFLLNLYTTSYILKLRVYITNLPPFNPPIYKQMVENQKKMAGLRRRLHRYDPNKKGLMKPETIHNKIGELQDKNLILLESM